MHLNELLAALAYAGAGSGLGAVIAAFITSRSQKGEVRAHAANMIATGYGALFDRLSADNARLARENAKLVAVHHRLLRALGEALDARSRQGQVPQDFVNDVLAAFDDAG